MTALLANRTTRDTVPILLSGDVRSSLPSWLHGVPHYDFSGGEDYYHGLIKMLTSMCSDWATREKDILLGELDEYLTNWDSEFLAFWFARDTETLPWGKRLAVRPAKRFFKGNFFDEDTQAAVLERPTTEPEPEESAPSDIATLPDGMVSEGQDPSPPAYHVYQIKNLVENEAMRFHQPPQVDLVHHKALSHFEDVLKQLDKYARESLGQKPKSCFISYAWPEKGTPLDAFDVALKGWVEVVAQHLEAAGMEVHLDRWWDEPGREISRFIKRVRECDIVLVCCTRLYNKKSEQCADDLADREPYVKAEMAQINALINYSTEQNEQVIPLLFEGSEAESVPILMRPKIVLPLTGDYFEGMLRLIRRLYGIPNRDAGFQALCDEFREVAEQIPGCTPRAENEAWCRERAQHWEQRQKAARRLARALPSGAEGGTIRKGKPPLEQRLGDDKGRRNLTTSAGSYPGGESGGSVVVTKVALPRIQSVLPVRSSNLRQKEPLLTQVAELFLADSDSARLVIYGLPGTGKTSLVTEYAHRLLEEEDSPYEAIRFINGSSPEKVEAGLRALADDAGIDCVGKQGHEWVQTLYHNLKDRPVLLILDGLEDIESMESYMPGLGYSHRVLLTSRQRPTKKTADRLMLTTVNMFDLNRKAIRVHFEKAHSAEGESDDLLQELHERLDGKLPPPISRPPAHSDLTGSRVMTYARYRRDPDDAPIFPEAEWSALLARIKAEHPDAFRLLFQLMLLEDPMSGSWLARLFVDDEKFYLSSQLLKRLCVLNQDGSSYSLHPSFRQFLGNRLDFSQDPGKHRWVARLLMDVYLALESGMPSSVRGREDYQLVEQLYRHYQRLNECLDWLPEGDANKGGYNRLRAELHARLGQCCLMTYRFDEARKWFGSELEERGAVGQLSGHPFQALAHHRLGTALLAGEDYGEAVDSLRQALEAAQVILPEDDVQLVPIHLALGDALLGVGQYEMAYREFKRATHFRRPVSLDFKDALVGLSKVLMYRGDYHAAKEYLERVVSDRSGGLDLQGARSLLVLSSLLTRMGSLDGAVAISREILEFYHHVYGQEHPAAVDALIGMGEALCAMGEASEARVHFEQAKAIFPERRMRSLRLERIQAGLGETYMMLGCFHEALEQYKTIWRHCREFVGPDPSLKLHNLGLIYAKMGQYNEAERHCEELLSKFRRSELDEKHPAVADILATLGEVYAQKGEYLKAIMYMQAARTIRSETFGSDHRFVGNLADKMLQLFLKQVREGESQRAPLQMAFAFGNIQAFTSLLKPESGDSPRETLPGISAEQRTHDSEPDAADASVIVDEALGYLDPNKVLPDERTGSRQVVFLFLSPICAGTGGQSGQAVKEAPGLFLTEPYYPPQSALRCLLETHGLLSDKQATEDDREEARQLAKAYLDMRQRNAEYARRLLESVGALDTLSGSSQADDASDSEEEDETRTPSP